MICEELKLDDCVLWEEVIGKRGSIVVAVLSILILTLREEKETIRQ